MTMRRLTAFFGDHRALHDINLSIAERQITAIIGPSGCGKSTLVRCLNRMHEMLPGATVAGEVLLDRENIYGAEVDPVATRRRVGMVFQKPTPFPSMSIAENVSAGLRLNGTMPSKQELSEIVERGLRQAALWDEVKDILGQRGDSLSGGQQQRLCIARALAVRPEVLLLDEPCSALDPISSARVEEVLLEIGARYTIVIVTHNMQQAARVSNFTAFLFNGELVEFGGTNQIFTNPERRQTEDYVTGRFG